MHNNGTLAAARNSLPALGVDPHPSPPAGGSSSIGVAAPSSSAAASSSSDKSPTRLEGNSSRSGVHSHSSTHSMLSTPRDETADSDDERDAHGAAAASAASAETIPSALTHAPLHDRSATLLHTEEGTQAAAATAAAVASCDIDDIIARLQSTRLGSGGADASVSGGHVADCAAAPKASAPEASCGGLTRYDCALHVSCCAAQSSSAAPLRNPFADKWVRRQWQQQPAEATAALPVATMAHVPFGCCD